VAYCSQVPWIVGGSLKENVLFGRRYEPQRYAAVLKACALEGGRQLTAASCWRLRSGGPAHAACLAGDFLPPASACRVHRRPSASMHLQTVVRNC
jgi:hypothetical protein